MVTIVSIISFSANAVPITAFSYGGTGIGVSGPADGVYGYGTALTGAYNSSLRQVCYDATVSYNLARLDLVPDVAWTGVTVSDNYVFEITSGYGQYTKVTPYTIPRTTYQLQPATQTIWTGWVENARRTTSGFYITSNSLPIKLEGRVESGITVLPSQQIYHLNCIDENGVIQEVVNVSLGQTTVTGNMLTCTPESHTAVVNMPTLSWAEATAATNGTFLKTTPVTFNMTCDSGISLRYAVMDLNDKTNTSTISTLTPDSTGSGFGYSIIGFKYETLQFGPDGSNKGIPGQTQYLYGATYAPDGTSRVSVSLPLQFAYMRNTSQPLKPGSLKSMIGLIYSYQ
ncbi:hypothetical protein RHO15_07600 [Utexia brackfieldae]|uniref:hypothetical protein n=1 Tax=Utexia brackfieldae TaxID=3074108 RepID=UPI00370D317E